VKTKIGGSLRQPSPRGQQAGKGHASTSVVTGTSNRAAILRHDMPSARRRIASSRLNIRFAV
jgi:hypothetical protein